MNLSRNFSCLKNTYICFGNNSPETIFPIFLRKKKRKGSSEKKQKEFDEKTNEIQVPYWKNILTELLMYSLPLPVRNLITSFIIPVLEQLTLLNLLAGAGTYVKKLLVYRYQYYYDELPILRDQEKTS